MQQAEFDVSTSEGVSLFQEIALGDIVLPKGYKLTKEDIVNLKLWGIKKVFGAIVEESDVKYDVALQTAVAKLCGEGTAYVIDDTICKVIADKDGAFICSDDRVAKFNRKESGIILNVIEPYSIIKKGDLIAKIEIIPAFMKEEELNSILYYIAGNTAILSVAPLKNRKSALVYAKFYDHKEESAHFTETVKKLVQDFPFLDFGQEYDAVHNIKSVSAAIDLALHDGNEIVFVLPGQRSASKTDIMFKALESVGDNIVNCCVPQVEMNDLIIAAKKENKIINVPYHYCEHDSTLVDKYIKQALANDNIYNFDFKHPQNAIISENENLSEEEEKNLVSAKEEVLGENDARIAIIILAAGIGARAGGNKLLIERKDGKPLFMSAVNAALKSKANPVFVITGYQKEQIEEALEDVDINIIHNSNYRAGVKTTITTGINSIPSFCEGAILLPADMPNISHTFLNKMIAAFKRGKNKQVIMAGYKGIKHNPILWSRDLFKFADLVPENANIRPVMVEFNDCTTLIDVKKETDILDVNYPNDVQNIIK